jgi:hypothetical protein
VAGVTFCGLFLGGFSAALFVRASRRKLRHVVDVLAQHRRVDSVQARSAEKRNSPRV